MIQLGRKAGSEQTQRTAMSRDGNTYTEAIPAMVVDFGGLLPTDGHLPLAPGSIIGAD